MFLRALNNELRPQLHAAFPRGYLEQEQQLTFLVGYILQIASRSKQAFSKMKLPIDYVANSRLTTTAGMALPGFLSSGMGSLETTRLIHEEKWNMRLADINFRSIAGPGSIRSDGPAAGENKILNSDDEEVSMSMIEAMVNMRSWPCDPRRDCGFFHVNNAFRG